MIVNIVNIVGIAFFKSKHNAPVRSHGYAPSPLEISLERVKAERRHFHIFNLARGIKARQYFP